jgi:putative ABC transport system ATP-binding protein
VTDAHAPAVVLRGVRYAWDPRGDPSLELEALRIARGERLFIEGPSGCGKSTLLGLVAGVLTPQAGSVEVLGTELPGLRPGARDRFRADHIGFVFQLFNLVPYLSVLDNVTLPCRFSALRRRRALATGKDLAAQARGLLDRLGLEDGGLPGRPVTALSVGQQQRVAVARALMGSPEIVIADEPTSALDAAHRDRFLELLFEACAASAATLLFVSHDAALGARFDRRLELAQVNRAGSPRAVAS